VPSGVLVNLMLGTLDRYIARQYLINVTALLVILFSFVITIDVSLNFDRFVNNAETFLKAGAAPNAEEPGIVRHGLTVVFLVLDLWWPRLLQLFNYLLGVVLIGGMGFTCAQLVRHRELVAVLASGVSLRRIARPILIVAIMLIGVQALNQELVLPRIAPLLTRDHGEAGKRGLGADRVKLIKDSQNRLFYARVFDADAEVLKDLYIWDLDDQGLARSRVYAPSATWDGRAWKLKGGVVESRSGAFRPPESITQIETNLDPAALRMQRYAGFVQSLSWRQLGQMLDRVDPEDQRTLDRLTRVQFGRISVMLSNFLALVVTLPFFLRREPVNMLAQSLKCAPLSVIALVGGVLGATAALPGVPAAIGVFVPVMVLVPLAIASVSSVRT
jgi:lipopolysaccharide export LptBFGC system permease protein LptF